MGPVHALHQPVGTPCAHRTSLPKRSFSRQVRKVRTVCGNSARTDLCGGLPERAVPTAILYFDNMVIARNGSKTGSGGNGLDAMVGYAVRSLFLEKPLNPGATIAQAPRGICHAVRDLFPNDYTKAPRATRCAAEPGRRSFTLLNKKDPLRSLLSSAINLWFLLGLTVSKEFVSMPNTNIIASYS